VHMIAWAARSSAEDHKTDKATEPGTESTGKPMSTKTLAAAR
jgi:hypothetical protein